MFRSGLRIENFNLVERMAFAALPEEVRNLFKFYETQSDEYIAKAGVTRLGIFIHDFARTENLIDEMIEEITRYLGIEEVNWNGFVYRLPLNNLTRTVEKIDILGELCSNLELTDQKLVIDLTDDLKDFENAMKTRSKCTSSWERYVFHNPSNYYIPNHLQQEIYNASTCLFKLRNTLKNLSIYLYKKS